jgi:3-hydroxyisobutyrate dehydrogenase-like beta-hydroxyacid dehydrogenase
LKISFLGVGLMGAPMVQRLIDHGFELTLWNRTVSKAAAYSEHACIANSPEDAIKDADIVITMLESGPIIDKLLYQSDAYLSLKTSCLVIDMSSITPEIARSHAEQVSSVNANYLDAPVSGGTVGAAQGALSIMVGGQRSAYEHAQPIFAALGHSTYIGPSGSGQLCKLANQAIVGITIGAVSEALLLASAGGADTAAVIEALSGGFASSRVLELHGKRMLERDFEPGATSRVQLKDMRSILDEARSENLTLPLSQRTYESYLSHIANGRENLDHSSLLLELEYLNQRRLTH